MILVIAFLRNEIWILLVRLSGFCFFSAVISLREEVSMYDESWFSFFCIVLSLSKDSDFFWCVFFETQGVNFFTSGAIGIRWISLSCLKLPSGNLWGSLVEMKITPAFWSSFNLLWTVLLEIFSSFSDQRFLRYSSERDSL